MAMPLGRGCGNSSSSARQVLVVRVARRKRRARIARRPEEHERAALDAGRTIADLCFEAVSAPEGMPDLPAGYVEQSPLPLSVPD